MTPNLVGSYFLIALKEAGQVWRIDYSKPDFPVEKLANAGRILHDGFLRSDDKRFYLASQTDNWIAVIDLENMEVVRAAQFGADSRPND